MTPYFGFTRIREAQPNAFAVRGLRPEKYEGLGKSEGIIEIIEIEKIGHEKPAGYDAKTD